MRDRKNVFFKPGVGSGLRLRFKNSELQVLDPAPAENGPYPQPCLNDQTHSFQHVILGILVAVLDMLEKNNNKIC